MARLFVVIHLFYYKLLPKDKFLMLNGSKTIFFLYLIYCISSNVCTINKFFYPSTLKVCRDVQSQCQSIVKIYKKCCKNIHNNLFIFQVDNFITIHYKNKIDFRYTVAYVAYLVERVYKRNFKYCSSIYCQDYPVLNYLIKYIYIQKSHPKIAQIHTHTIKESKY